jgi:5-methylcytosine-specific restriction protein B
VAKAQRRLTELAHCICRRRRRSCRSAVSGRNGAISGGRGRVRHVDQPAVGNAVLFRTALEVLRDASRPVSAQDALAKVAERLPLTGHWQERYDNGLARWDVGVRFFTGDAATIGWLTKRGGWTITEAGLAALEEFPTADELCAKLQRRYREIDQRRRQARRNLSGVQQFIARTLGLVLGRFLDRPGRSRRPGRDHREEVADFLASGQVWLANAYRVLKDEGSIPPEGELNAAYRGTDLRAWLAAEGVEFSADGRAGRDQRLTADALRDLLEADIPQEPGSAAAPARRAWMIRGSNVDGYNLVPQWLRDGFVSLSASQLSGLAPNASDEGSRPLTWCNGS